MTPVEAMLGSNGRIFTVTFIKKDGSTRSLNGRMGVKKFLAGGTRTTDPEQYLIVYDLKNEGYRAVNRNTIISVKLDGVVYTTACEL